jgi:hypothetical protein
VDKSQTNDSYLYTRLPTANSIAKETPTLSKKQELKNQIKLAYSDASTLPPSQQRIDTIKALENKLQKKSWMLE